MYIILLYGLVTGNCFVSPKRNKGNILSVTEQELKVRKLNIKNDEKYNNIKLDNSFYCNTIYSGYKTHI